MSIYISTPWSFASHLPTSHQILGHSKLLNSNTRSSPTSTSRCPQTQHFSSHTCLVWKNTNTHDLGHGDQALHLESEPALFGKYLVVICSCAFSSSTSHCIIISFLISFVTLGATTKFLGFRVHKICGKHGWEKNLLYLRNGFLFLAAHIDLLFNIWLFGSHLRSTQKEKDCLAACPWLPRGYAGLHLY